MAEVTKAILSDSSLEDPVCEIKEATLSVSIQAETVDKIKQATLSASNLADTMDKIKQETLSASDLAGTVGQVKHTTLPEIESLLRGRSVAFKEIPESMLAQIPSTRIVGRAFLFPGSKFKLSHVILISQDATGLLLITAYSKSLRFEMSEYSRLLLKALELNANEPSVCWKLEKRSGFVVPVLEMLIGTLVFDKDLTWKCFGVLDSRFKATSEELLVHPPQQSDVPLKVKTFLTEIGFTRIKEAVIEGGHSLLVVLSDDDQFEASDIKRFPLKIEITKLIVFKIYFSLKDAAVTAKSHFRSSAMHLIAQGNWKLPAGYYNYSSNSDQIQLTMKLNYSLLSTAEFQTSLKYYYETIITYYKQTNESLAKLYEKVMEDSESISNMAPFLALTSPELQEEDQWEHLDYTGTPSDYDQDSQMLLQLEQSEELRPYFLSPPFFKLNPEAKKIYVKKKSTLIDFQQFMNRFPNFKYKVFENSLNLMEAMKPFNVFPTPRMLYFKEGSPNIIILPGKSFLKRVDEFLQESLIHGLEEWDVLGSTLNLDKLTMEGYAYIPIDQFITPITTRFNQYLIGKSKLAGEECIFYQIDSSAKSLKFLLLFEEYRSLLFAKIPKYSNPLICWTEGVDMYLTQSDLILFDSESQISIFYICEKCILKLWRGNEPIATMIQIAEKLSTLHLSNMCHWFVSPLTIRQDPKTKLSDVVLPVMNPFYGEFVMSMIPKDFKEYIAPEVKRYLKGKQLPENLFAADIFSLCKVIEEILRQTLKMSTPSIVSLANLVNKGLSKDPSERPGIKQLTSALKDVQKNNHND